MTYQTDAETLIRERGTDSQRERLEAGALDVDEAVREILFRPLAGMPRWDRVPHAHIRRLAELRGIVPRGDRSEVTFMVETVAELTDDQWARYKAAQEALPDATFKLFTVVASIGEHLVRRMPKARVILQFGDRDWVTELDLGDRPAPRQRKITVEHRR
jgi:hypothetical protein